MLLLLVLLAAFLGAGCAATKQYVIPHRPDGTLAASPKWKVRTSFCANCYMWHGMSSSPRSFLFIAEDDGLTVEVRSSHRCFAWFLVVPISGWGSCSPTVTVPSTQVVHVRVTNNSRDPHPLVGGPIFAVKGGKSIGARQHELFPTQIAAGETVVRSADLGQWGDIGWGYSLDLSQAVVTTLPPIRMERFTSTTFGLVVLD